jgi:hypothetical protein
MPYIVESGKQWNFAFSCRFMESEVELHETIQEMHAVATVPDLYPIMVELQAVPSLLELLAHENTDIAVAVVDLLQVSAHVCDHIDFIQASVHM